MAKRIKDKDNRILVKELDAILQEDKIVQIGYFSGGDDSGGCDFSKFLSKLSYDSEIHLHYLCNDSLDYGGWNGSFSASGDIYYDPINKTIEIEGSEFNNVYVYQDFANEKVWSSAKWFYTAVTRSNKKLNILPNPFVNYKYKQ